MKIYPAIDIMDGKVVRLFKGDYGTSKSYALTVEQAAASFKASGASGIHVVDLDGAKLGVAVNADSVSRILSVASGMEVEVGGGIRSEKQIRAYLDAGAARVILGTVAAENFGFVVDMTRKYRGKISVGVDAVNGKVAVSGWRKVTDTDALEFCKALAPLGLSSCIYTDISRDGTLGGTNLKAYKTLVKIDGLNITASGGISSLDEIVALKNMGVHSAILGKALYENRLDLGEAVKAAEGKD